MLFNKFFFPTIVFAHSESSVEELTRQGLSMRKRKRKKNNVE